MKQSLLVLVMAFLVPVASVHALSCVPDSALVEECTTSAEYTILTATPLRTREYVTEHGVRETYEQYEGYTSQLLDVSRLHRGSAQEKTWVYFQVDRTWGYLCAGEPPVLNEERLYVIRRPANTFDVPTVVATYVVESEAAQEIIRVLAEQGVENELYQRPAAEIADGLAYEIKRMIMYVRMKLDEWRYWRGL